LQGCRIIPCGRNKNKLNEYAQLGNRVTPLSFDITKASEVELAAAQISDIDIFICNAGDCQYIEQAKYFDAKVFSDVINTNLISLGLLLESFLPKVNRGGQVVFISSSATLMPFPKAEAYGASKAGVDYLANSLRLDLKQENIGVTLVHPGFIKTPLTDKNQFNMPFILSASDAAKRIATAIDSRKHYLNFPKRLTWFLKVFSILPVSLWHKLLVRTS